MISAQASVWAFFMSDPFFDPMIGNLFTTASNTIAEG